MKCWQAKTRNYFYPRPPRGGRHFADHALAPPNMDFYPRPPRGGRPAFRAASSALTIISIHALREEGDLILHSVPSFLLIISIHALREEGDIRSCSTRTVMLNFYPRPPRGGRPSYRPHRAYACYFYPRPPRGGRPCCQSFVNNNTPYFYPRPPRGGRPVCRFKRR